MKKHIARDKINYSLKNYNDSDKPFIIKAKWGQIDVSYMGEVERYKDVIIWPNGHKKWDWSISNTHHTPGIQISDIKKLIIRCKCNYIILSTGFEDVLQVPKETIIWLNKHKINYEIANSMDAIKLYNENTNDNIGILLHSTC